MGDDATIRYGRNSDATRVSPARQGATQAPASRGTSGARVVAAAALEPGDSLKERWQLDSVLGSGGMGTVFLARDKWFRERLVAVKVMTGDFARHPDAKEAIKEEALKSLDLAHENVVKVQHYDEHGEHPFIVMEYLRGIPLNTFIAQHPVGVSFAEAWPIVQQMALGLSYIHKHGMVHYDFKPGNVFLTDGTVKIVDLGIARATSRARLPASIFDVGGLNALCPPYASVEMFEQLPPDPRDDIYAVGCTAYELLTGKHPFQRQTSVDAQRAGLKPARIEGLSDRRWRALQQALEFRREQRPATVEAFLTEFEAVRNPWPKRLAAVGALSAVGAAALAAWMIPSANADGAFVQGLLEQSGTGTPTAEQQIRIDNWLAQGRDYVADALESFETAGKESAIIGDYTLRSGPSDNAEYAFRKVLELTRSDAAARGLLDIANAYATGAAARQSSDRQTALWLACQGFAVHPNHVDLRSLIDKLGDTKDGTDFAGACDASR